MTETVDAKAQRYLAEGRLQIVAVRGDRVKGQVRGSAGELYVVEHVGAGRWRCSCPSSRRCAHIAAVALVTTPQRAEVTA